MDERNYEVYRHTNLTNGKVYIGASRLGWETRWKSKYRSNRRLNLDIGLTTEADWSHEVLAGGLTMDEARKEEIKQIALHNSVDPTRGYNQKIVSFGVASGDEPWEEGRIQKISRSMAKRWGASERKAKGQTKFKRPFEANAAASETLSARVGKPVYCLETCKTYRSIGEASRVLECNQKVVKAVLDGKRKSTHGYHFRYADGIGEDKERRVRVACVETGVVYSSMKEAAEDTGATSSGISQCCKGIRKICAGYHWRYAE